MRLVLSGQLNLVTLLYAQEGLKIKTEFGKIAKLGLSEEGCLRKDLELYRSINGHF